MAKKTVSTSNTSKKKTGEPKARRAAPKAAKAPKPRPAAPKPAKKKSPAKRASAAKATPAAAARAAATPHAVEPKRPVRPGPRATRGEDKKADREAQRARARSLRRFRQMLLEKYDDLVRAYNSSRGDTRRVTSDGTEDYIDYAVSSYDRDFSLSLSEMERTQMRMIEDALRRIERGEYGDCQQCGEPIPEKRLEVEPWARHCVRCQALEEQGLLAKRPYDADYEDGEGGGEEEYVEVEAAEEEEEEEDEEEEEEDEALEGGGGAAEPADDAELPDDEEEDEDEEEDDDERD
jgi:DnaK suppressor protein